MKRTSFAFCVMSNIWVFLKNASKLTKTPFRFLCCSPRFFAGFSVDKYEIHEICSILKVFPCNYNGIQIAVKFNAKENSRQKCVESQRNDGRRIAREALAISVAQISITGCTSGIPVFPNAVHSVPVERMKCWREGEWQLTVFVCNFFPSKNMKCPFELFAKGNEPT